MRLTLVVLLVVSTAWFAGGVIAERSDAGGHPEPATVRSQESGEGAHEHGDGGEAGATRADERETVLGVDIESTPLIVLAVIAGLGLAAIAASPLGRRSGVLLAIAAIAIAWAALDVREAVHQLAESRTGIAIVAMAVAVLHLACAALAGWLAARARDAGHGDHVRPLRRSPRQQSSRPAFRSVSYARSRRTTRRS